MEKVNVYRVSLRIKDPDLLTDRLHGVGFRGISTYGWQGPVRVLRKDAVADVEVYRATIPQAARKGEAMPPDGVAEAS